MKKIAAIAATTLSLSILSLSPSQAAEGDLIAAAGSTCTTSGGSDPVDLLNMRVYDNGGGTFLAKANFRDSNIRTWNWKLYHNGDVVRSGTISKDTDKGSYGVDGTIGFAYVVADFVGTDRLRYEFTNGSGTVTCETRVGVDYGN